MHIQGSYFLRRQQELICSSQGQNNRAHDCALRAVSGQGIHCLCKGEKQARLLRAARTMKTHEQWLNFSGKCLLIALSDTGIHTWGFGRSLNIFLTNKRQMDYCGHLERQYIHYPHLVFEAPLELF